MTDTPVKSPRERYRVQMQAEIKQCAWEQMATDGPSALSLNAIAKNMGLSGPALYRYYASRDELITALIRDSYRSLADILRAARDSGADVTGLAYAAREWALANPQRYFLIYGTPIPGYHAPDDTVAITQEIMAVLIEAFVAQPVDEKATPFDANLEHHRHWAPDNSVPTTTVHRALSFWTRTHGVLSLELAGHFTGMEFDPALLYADELNSLVSL
ncbi:TetR/AcrR family transcriptional regulator [Nocardia iowensis]|uniref:TetR/AcrR family transcriptional regulator n=1 Tax=Nocardia iowensis TaxID=204891 RepID=A0ABX8RIB8_NOCIO|nr:TetR/AcrR family transcriptional regulator [Nocardia iowensis]QXN88722.1 TetR/AcrR family transcriptional regulator [Nocardia iowensis]